MYRVGGSMSKEEVKQKDAVKILETKDSITLSYTLAASGLVFSAKAYDLFALVCQKTKKLMTKYDFEHISQGNVDKVKIKNQIHITREEIAEEWGTEIKRLPWAPIKIKNKDGSVTEKPSLLEEAAKELGRQIPYKSKDKKTWGYVNIIQAAYFDQTGLTIRLTDDAIVAIYNRTKGFGLVDLKLFFKLKSKYSKKLFDLLSVNKHAPYDLDLSISEYKIIMGYDEPIRKKDDVKYKNDFSNFSRRMIIKPVEEIVEASKVINKGKVWVIDKSKGSGKGYSIIRQVSNRTSSRDRIIFHLNYIDNENCSPKESAKKFAKIKIDVPNELLKLSKVVAAWRKGRPPSNEQYIDIAKNLAVLNEDGLLTTDDFGKLSKAVPPKG